MFSVQVYWVGPIIGAITGGLLYEYCIRSTSEQRVLADIEDMDGFSDDANVVSSLHYSHIIKRDILLYPLVLLDGKDI